LNYFVSKKSSLPSATIVENALNEVRARYKEGEEVEIVVKRAEKSRTGQQSKYFWSLCGLIEKESGQDKDVVKGRLMHALGHTQSYWSNGVAITETLSTTKLKVEQFAELIEATQSLCQMLSIKYPLPAELGLRWT